ncbi:MAG: VWA domain-containing protein [Bacteroidia bacterium]|nr:VWA domain-containing protein [Bacteroidia bacterium]
MHFRNPELLWLLLLVPVMILYFLKVKRYRRPQMRISSTEAFRHYRPSWKQRLINLPIVLRILAVAFMVVALARPQSSSKASNVKTEGISIVIALDISSSMLAEDFRPNRIEAAKKVALDFIDGRPNDLIGLVIFSGQSFTQCPLTSDHSVLRNLLKDIKSGMLKDGTAIGEGLATAVSRLKDASTKSKVVVVITDGVNNAGSIPPMTAGEIASTFGVRVYSIGVGTRGMAPYPTKTLFGIQYQNMEVQIDEELLTKVAEITDGRYFRAVNNKRLEAIFNEIDKLEKSKIEITEFKRYTEEYLPFAFLACMLLLLELTLRYTWLRSIP